MDGGVAQLLFILFIIVAALLDFIGRNQEKRRKMEEMEKEDAQEEGALEGEGAPSSTRRDRGEMATKEAGPSEGERETADSMVPSDLWEEILGGIAGTPTEKKDEAPPREPEREREEFQRAEFEWEAERSRPGTESEPVAAERSPSVQRAEPEQERKPRSARRTESEREATPLARLSEKELMDRAKKEERSLRLGRAERKKKARPSPRGEAPDDWAELFSPGDPSALRRAVVYREVLGKPLALRGQGGWEEEGG